MAYRVYIFFGILAAVALWAGLAWQVLGTRHSIPYDPPLRCLQAALPLAPGHIVSQTVQGRASDLSGIALSFRTTASATVAVQIQEVSSGQAAPVADATVTLPANHPFYTVTIAFPPQAQSAGKTYALHLRSTSDQTEPGAAPLVWSCWSDSFAFGDLMVDGEPAHGDLFIEPLYERSARGAVQAVTARFQGIRIGILPAWLWGICLAIALLGMPTLAVWVAGGRLGSLTHLIAVLIVLPLIGLGVFWGNPRLHRPVVLARESTGVSQRPTPTKADLLIELRKEAIGDIAPQETWNRQPTFSLAPVTRADGEGEIALRTSINTTVTWRDVVIAPESGFAIRAEVDPGQWTSDDGPIEVRITAVVNGVTLLDVQEILVNAQETFSKLSESLDLSAYAGQALTLTLATQGDTRNSANLVVWTGLVFD
jgi:hypothetical protein